MKRWSVYLLVIFFVFLTGQAAAEQSAAEAVIESISYEKDEHNREKIIFKLNGAHIPKVFKIKGEQPRLVFDFIDTRYSDLINRITDTKGNLIKGVRVGIHDDPPKTRVVVDLKAEGEYQFEQDFLIQENILSITFYPSEPAAARQKPVQAGKPAKPAAEPATVKPPPAGTAAELEPRVGTEEPVAAERIEAVAGPPAPVAATVEPEPPPAAVPKERDGAAATDDVVSLLAGAESRPEPTVDPILREVSFDGTTNNSEMVLFKLNDFYPPIVFAIEKGNPRVVCDFLDTELDAAVRPIIDTNGNYVNRIRVAKHDNPAKVRVVLDLVANRNYDLQQVFFKEDNLFVIVINEFEDEPAATPPAVEVPSSR